MATARRKVGRPSDYTEELADRICEEIANSDTSLRRICARADMPDRKTVLRWLAQHDDFAAKYARAREGQADVIFEEMGDLEQKMLTRKVASDVGRVVLQSKQWRAAKLANKKYGERVTSEITGPDGKPLQVESKINVGDLSDEQLRALASIPVQAR